MHKCFILGKVTINRMDGLSIPTLARMTDWHPFCNILYYNQAHDLDMNI